MTPSYPYRDYLNKTMQDPKRAAGYLEAALEDSDPRVFLLALKDVIEAQGGMTKIARHAKMSREHLYRMLSLRGNPGFLGLGTLLAALGFKFSITSDA